MGTVKEQARDLLESLPEDVGWDDIMYELYVRQKISSGHKAEKSGRTIPHDEVRKRFGGQ